VEAGQLTVVPSTVPADLGGTTKGDIGTSLDQWSKFCAAADGGGELASAAVAAGVAASVAQQLRYVSFFHNFGKLQRQVTTFVDQVALGALTSQLIFERKRLEGRIEHIRTQHTEAIRDKSATEKRAETFSTR
jgi:transposase